MAKTKIFDGTWECPECGQQYECEAVREDHLVCDDCGTPLEPAEEEEEDEDSEPSEPDEE